MQKANGGHRQGQPEEAVVAVAGTDNIVRTTDAMLDVLRSAQRVAVIGIKPESHASQPAHYVPRYLQRVGYEIVPVPVYYPEVTEILGEPVFRKLMDVPGKIDLVVVFRRPELCPPHAEEAVACGSGALWLQLGFVSPEARRIATGGGLDYVEDACTAVVHARMKAGRGG